MLLGKYFIESIVKEIYRECRHKFPRKPYFSMLCAIERGRTPPTSLTANMREINHKSQCPSLKSKILIYATGTVKNDFMFL